MTKKLEELLNLPESQEIVDEEKAKEVKADVKKVKIEDHESTKRDIAELDKITAALPQVKGLGDMSDTEVNDISSKAIDAYEDLMDLGMNVESRYSSRVFEVAGQMLKTALDARVAKIDKKLKMVDLQLKKQKQDSKQGVDDTTNIVQGEGYVITDRNSLLEKLKKLAK